MPRRSTGALGRFRKMSGADSSIPASQGDLDLIELFENYAVEYLITGGTAALVHGCREASDVADLDILVSPTLGNAQKVIAALTVGRINVQFSPERLAKPEALIKLKVLHYNADILTPPESPTFAELASRSVPVGIGKWKVKVVSRPDLIALVERALTRPNVDVQKIERDLKCLRSA